MLNEEESYIFNQKKRGELYLNIRESGFEIHFI